MSTRRSHFVAIAVSCVLLYFAPLAASASASSAGFGPSVPGLSTGNAFPAAQTASAKVHGRVNDNFNETYASCSFEYGTDTTYNLGSVPCVEEEGPFSSGFGARNVDGELSGLQPGVTYHYRLVATTAEASNRDSIRPSPRKRPPRYRASRSTPFPPSRRPPRQAVIPTLRPFSFTVNVRSRTFQIRVSVRIRKT